MQRLLRPQHLKLLISWVLIFNISEANAQNTDSLLLDYIKNYKVKYECYGEKVKIPRFSNIDSNLYYKIESEFKNGDYHLLYLLIVPLRINHSIYVKQFKTDYIIDDGLICQENSIIKLIRIAMKDSSFIISKSSSEIETTGDILYWVELNKKYVSDYGKINTYLKKNGAKRR